MRPSDLSIPLRKMIYTLLIVLAAGHLAGRTLSVAWVYEPEMTWPKQRPVPVPTHGDNDRSRWDTVRALVDQGTYSIGRRDPGFVGPDNKYGDEGIITESGWKTIDKVLDPETHRFYSSKPPFLPTLLAGEYWLLKKAFGWSITEQRFLVVRTILFTVNWLPFVIFLVLLSRLAEELGTTDWGRIFVVASGCFGTLMLPFVTTLNNHTIAACSAMFALYPVLSRAPFSSILSRAPFSSLLSRARSKRTEEDRASRMEDGGSRMEDRESTGDPDRESQSSILDPPSSLSVPRSSILHPQSSYLLAGFFAGFTACSELPATSFLVSLFLILFWLDRQKALALYLPAAAIPIAFFFLTNYWAIGQLKPAYGEFGGPWYEYEGSHWLTKPGETPHGIDFAYLYESKASYAFHLLLGHHGLFSLTPIFLLGLAGAVYGVVTMMRGSNPGRRPGLIAGLTMTLLVVVAAFYIVIAYRNYGGWTAGPRWLIWLTPFLLLTMLPAADWLAPRRWGRILAYAFLAISLISASYPAWNPWRQPWLYNLMEKLDWIRY